jgi:hypothetical protein
MEPIGGNNMSDAKDSSTYSRHERELDRLMSVVDITNLIGRYAERVDAGDLAGAAALFGETGCLRHRRQGENQNAKHLDMIEHVGSHAIYNNWKTNMIIYPDGTPRTRHVTTNIVIEVDEDAQRATGRSYCTVLQANAEFPLQVICTSQYRDVFERSTGEWLFAVREIPPTVINGDRRNHNRNAPAPGDAWWDRI